MRPIHSLPLVAAIMLAACGGGADEADGVSGEDVAAAAGGAPTLEPGQYEVSYQLLEFDIPGAPESVKQQAQAAMGGASEVAKGFSYCLTPEEAGKGPQGMLEQMAERDCTFAKFDVSGGTVSADMQCAEDDGTTIHMLMDGEMSSTGSTMTMTLEQEIAGMGAVRMKSRATSRRTGDCA
jgi:hypothetical protein